MKDNKDVDSLSHTTWRCQYHVVFAPKYRGKYSSDRDTLRVECKSAVFHADFLLLRLSRFGNSTGSNASS